MLLNTEVITSHQDAFGMQITERSWSSSASIYGFNGYNKDDELKGEGNSIDFGARVYDTRIAKFLSLDPITYSFWSPYQYDGNSPINSKDILGMGPSDPPEFTFAQSTSKKYAHSIKLFSTIFNYTTYGSSFNATMKKYRKKHTVIVVAVPSANMQDDAHTQLFTSYEQFANAKEGFRKAGYSSKYDQVATKEAKAAFKGDKKVSFVFIDEKYFSDVESNLKDKEDWKAVSVWFSVAKAVETLVHETYTHARKHAIRGRTPTSHEYRSDHEDFEGSYSDHTPDETIPGTKADKTFKESFALAKFFIKLPYNFKSPKVDQPIQ